MLRIISLEDYAFTPEKQFNLAGNFSAVASKCNFVHAARAGPAKGLRRCDHMISVLKSEGISGFEF